MGGNMKIKKDSKDKFTQEKDEIYKREQKITKQIIKTHNKYHKVKNSYDTFGYNVYHNSIPSTLQFILSIGLPLGLGFLAGLLAAPHMLAIVAATIGFLTSSILMSAYFLLDSKFGFSNKIYDLFDKEERLKEKLNNLEYKLRHECGFSKEGTVSRVPEGKIEDYLKGDFKCEKTYLVTIEDKAVLLTLDEIAKLREQGFEFNGIIGANGCKVLTPEEVEEYKSKGCEFVRYGIDTLMIKDSKVINETDNYRNSNNTYAHEINETKKQEKSSLIAKLLQKANITAEVEIKTETNKIDESENVQIID